MTTPHYFLSFGAIAFGLFTKMLEHNYTDSVIHSTLLTAQPSYDDHLQKYSMPLIGRRYREEFFVPFGDLALVMQDATLLSLFNRDIQSLNTEIICLEANDNVRSREQKCSIVAKVLSQQTPNSSIAAYCQANVDAKELQISRIDCQQALSLETSIKLLQTAAIPYQDETGKNCIEYNEAWIFANLIDVKGLAIEYDILAVKDLAVLCCQVDAWLAALTTKKQQVRDCAKFNNSIIDNIQQRILFKVAQADYYYKRIGWLVKNPTHQQKYRVLRSELTALAQQYGFVYHKKSNRVQFTETFRDTVNTRIADWLQNEPDVFFYFEERKQLIKLADLLKQNDFAIVPPLPLGPCHDRHDHNKFDLISYIILHCSLPKTAEKPTETAHSHLTLYQNSKTTHRHTANSILAYMTLLLFNYISQDPDAVKKEVAELIKKDIKNKALQDFLLVATDYGHYESLLRQDLKYLTYCADQRLDQKCINRLRKLAAVLNKYALPPSQLHLTLPSGNNLRSANTVKMKQFK